MYNFIVGLAGAGGGDNSGVIEGGSSVPSLPLGDGVSFGFGWVYDVLQKILRVFGTLFDFMANPMYTWLDFPLSWFGFSEEQIQSIIENTSKMDFFQMTFYDVVLTLLPVYIVIVLLSWVIRCVTGPLTDGL